jgi:hypothetical protein
MLYECKDASYVGFDPDETTNGMLSWNPALEITSIRQYLFYVILF